MLVIVQKEKSFRIKFRFSSRRWRLSNEKFTSSVFNWSKTVDYRQAWNGVNGAMRVLLGLRPSNRTGWLIERTNEKRTNTSHFASHLQRWSAFSFPAGKATRRPVASTENLRMFVESRVKNQWTDRSTKSILDKIVSSSFLYDQYLTSAENEKYWFSFLTSNEKLVNQTKLINWLIFIESIWRRTHTLDDLRFFSFFRLMCSNARDFLFSSSSLEFDRTESSKS